MCENCGCSTNPHVHAHPHGHESGHEHGHDHTHELRVLGVGESPLAWNDRLAERNRGFFEAKRIAVFNLVSSPGSGKTALLERTLRDLAGKHRMGVIVGDLATENDAERLRKTGIAAVQISTGTTCHLDAHMVQHALEDIATDELEVLFIENVGNLVCPASFDLGEDERVVVTSVTEGEDKPLKYPVIFRDASVVLVNKIDIAAAAEFNRELALSNIREVAPEAAVFEVSAKTGAGMEDWYRLIAGTIAAKHL